MKTFVRIAMLSVIVLLGGCLESKIPVLSLNVGHAPDISGTYVYNNVDRIFTKSDKGENAYSITSSKEKGRKSFALVEALDNENIIIQIDDNKNSRYFILPAKLQKDGIIFYIVSTDDGKNIAWKDSVWKSTFDKYNIGYTHDANDIRANPKNMTQEQYREAMKSAFAEIFAANAFGNGRHYKKAPGVKIGRYANDAVFRGEFRWHIILNADNTFTLAIENFEGPQTLTGTWSSDGSGNVTARIAKGKSVVFTGGGTDVLTLTVWPYGNAFNNTPLYYDASQAAPPAKSAAPVKSLAPAKSPVSDAPAKSAAPTPPAATPAPGSPNTPAAPAPVQASPAPPIYPPFVQDTSGKPQIAGHPLRYANGVMDIALQILAPGRTLEAVRIDTAGGAASSAWRSDGKDAAKPLTLMDYAVLLADGRAAMSLALGNAETLLTASFTDDGSVAGGAAELRITAFFTDTSRAECLLGNIQAFLKPSGGK